MVRALSAGEVLGREEEEVVADRKYFCLRVKVVDGGGGMTSGDQPQGAILYQLQTPERGEGVLWEDDGGRLVDEGTN